MKKLLLIAMVGAMVACGCDAAFALDKRDGKAKASSSSSERLKNMQLQDQRQDQRLKNMQLQDQMNHKTQGEDLAGNVTKRFDGTRSSAPKQ